MLHVCTHVYYSVHVHVCVCVTVKMILSQVRTTTLWCVHVWDCPRLQQCFNKSCTGGVIALCAPEMLSSSNPLLWSMTVVSRLVMSAASVTRDYNVVKVHWEMLCPQCYKHALSCCENLGCMSFLTCGKTVHGMEPEKEVSVFIHVLYVVWKCIENWMET